MGNCGRNCDVKYKDYFREELYTWCTGCGNYGIHSALKRALVNLKIKPINTVLCFDIGCHGNGADKIGGYGFHGLHGRVLPLAAGICIANRNLKVVAFGGDGGTFSEGINHLIHSIRNNYNFTFVLHDNKNYGLTTGQASSTTPSGIKMNSSPDGVTSDVLNPMSLLLSLDPPFVARGFSGDIKHMSQILEQAISYKGFSYVEILQNCPTYNKATTHEWYMENIVNIDDREYDPTDIMQAKNLAENGIDGKIPIGILYKNEQKKSFMDRQENRIGVNRELAEEVSKVDIRDLLQSFI